MGVAILAGVGTGIFESVESACKDMIKADSHTEFDAQNAAEYDK